jgi:chromosomal replication initiator protein
MFIAHIQAAVASYYELPLASMSSKQQYWKVAHPRQLAMFLAAELTDHSLAEIGRRFNRDHTTVMHALKAVQKRIQDDPEVGLDAEVLRERLAA